MKKLIVVQVLVCITGTANAVKLTMPSDPTLVREIASYQSLMNQIRYGWNSFWEGGSNVLPITVVVAVIVLVGLVFAKIMHRLCSEISK